ncbi:MAG TPA: putative exosortase B-associated extracellular polysaccharide biosynthesis transporter EpsL [Methylotenera sp.]|nr:putative exosortase B-associated extracellular polysaccharide biosynthesis transporter EpsL [Methylotenera sp.]HPH06314.1 putative exosortase B-associated extracellular polysaccharide biosynthesis transporter EpsL [Methylotenera sp.]HPN00340.1 putative exosortase B-associated extracellular polysaccharide biosynthesis transporter EpsL [Methylotenera sp.]
MNQPYEQQMNARKNIQLNGLTGVLLLLLSSTGLLYASNSHADQQDPLNFIVGVSRMHDNNLFRSSKNERSENITSAYAGIRLDKQYAQQRFKFDFTLTANRYQNFDLLDFNAKDYKAAWLWTLTPYLTGTISLDRKQTLNSFQDFQGTSLVNIRNLNVRETQHFEADFSPHNVWHILGGFTRSTQKNSNNSNSFVGQDSFVSNSLDAGVRYNFRSGSSVAAMSHLRQGDYKDRQLNAAALFDTAYDEQEVEAKLDWILSGKSRLNARAAYVTRDHDHFSDRDYSGLVGNVDFSWSPTAKIRMILSATSNLSTYQTSDTSYTRSTSFSVKPVYELSSKVTMNAHMVIAKRSFLDDGSLPDSDRVDWTKSAGFGIDWMPLRSVSVGGNLERSSRNSNKADLDYSDTTASVNANLFF